MSFIKQAKADKLAQDAARARTEGRQVFVGQLRAGVSHSPMLSGSVSTVAEMIEAIEAEGWHLDQMTSFPYDKNITIVGVFRRSP